MVVTTFVNINNLLDTEQHGFSRGLYCKTNLPTTREGWIGLLDNWKSDGVAYVDFSETFDIVPHSRLISGLVSLGITSAKISQRLLGR